jgi:hypothetical protein
VGTRFGRLLAGCSFVIAPPSLIIGLNNHKARGKEIAKRDEGAIAVAKEGLTAARRRA